MTSSITPGLWQTFTYEDISPEDLSRYVISSDNVLIADCYADFPDIHLGLPEKQEYRANALLIAAAPDLLKALECLREDMRMLRDQEWDGNAEGAQFSIDIADEALAKAKGEES